MISHKNMQVLLAFIPWFLYSIVLYMTVRGVGGWGGAVHRRSSLDSPHRRKVLVLTVQVGRRVLRVLTKTLCSCEAVVSLLPTA